MWHERQAVIRAMSSEPRAAKGRAVALVEGDASSAKNQNQRVGGARRARRRMPYRRENQDILPSARFAVSSVGWRRQARQLPSPVGGAGAYKAPSNRRRRHNARGEARLLEGTRYSTLGQCSQR